MFFGLFPCRGASAGEPDILPESALGDNLQEVGRGDGTRTRTGRILSPLPLPLGYSPVPAADIILASVSFLPRLILGIGALLIGAMIAFSAWHAHGLVEQLDSQAYDSFQRGIEQQGVAGLGLMACGLLLHLRGQRLVALAALMLALGILLFAGDVYLGALSGEFLGVAPMGGSLSILGWLVLAISQFLPSRGHGRV